MHASFDCTFWRIFTLDTPILKSSALSKLAVQVQHVVGLIHRDERGRRRGEASLDAFMASAVKDAAYRLIAGHHSNMGARHLTILRGRDVWFINGTQGGGFNESTLARRNEPVVNGVNETSPPSHMRKDSKSLDTTCQQIHRIITSIRGCTDLLNLGTQSDVLTHLI